MRIGRLSALQRQQRRRCERTVRTCACHIVGSDSCTCTTVNVINKPVRIRPRRSASGVHPGRSQPAGPRELRPGAAGPGSRAARRCHVPPASATPVNSQSVSYFTVPPRASLRGRTLHIRAGRRCDRVHGSIPCHPWVSPTLQPSTFPDTPPTPARGMARGLSVSRELCVSAPSTLCDLPIWPT